MMRISIELDVPPAKAFTLFTEHVSAWWPPSRRHTKDLASRLFLTQSGRFWERAADGLEVDLGRVRVWDPPHRLELDFYVGTDAAHPTDVVVTFELREDRTLVTVVHRPTSASEALWNLRKAKFEASWDIVLPALKAGSATIAVP